MFLAGPTVQSGSARTATNKFDFAYARYMHPRSPITRYRELTLAISREQPAQRVAAGKFPLQESRWTSSRVEETALRGSTRLQELSSGSRSSVVEATHEAKPHVRAYTRTPFTLTVTMFLSLFCAVPPTIAPFSFKKDLSEGLRAQVTCMVEKGDPPFTIIWSKDGEPISAPGTAAAAFGPAAAAAAAAVNDPRHSQTPPGLRVTNIDAHSSAIVIERVTAAHTGNYTCLARNSVAEVLWTAELIVRGKVESQLPRNAPSLCLVFFFLYLSHVTVLHLAAHHCLCDGTVTAGDDGIGG